MFKKFLQVILGILIAAPLVGGLVGIKLGQFSAMAEAGANMKMPPTPVNTAKVKTVAWQPEIEAVGTMVPVKGTIVKAEADGVIEKIHFTPGTYIEKGKPLLELDIDIETAQLHEAQVAEKWARVAFNRAQELSKTKNISRAEMDTAETNIRQAEARVQYIKALIAQKTLYAPFSGQLGISEITEGHYVSKGAPIISLQTLNPITVQFTLPQNKVSQAKKGLEIDIVSDAYPGKTFTGKIWAIDPHVDPITRNVRVEAFLDNPESLLIPGMFVSVNIRLDQTVNKMFIPATAILYGPYSNSVYVLEERETDDGAKLFAKPQVVRLGIKKGDFIEVTEGLTPGTEIISTGSFKLMPEMEVIVDNSLAPTFEMNPTPDNN